MQAAYRTSGEYVSSGSWCERVELHVPGMLQYCQLCQMFKYFIWCVLLLAKAGAVRVCIIQICKYQGPIIPVQQSQYLILLLYVSDVRLKRPRRKTNVTVNVNVILQRRGVTQRHRTNVSSFETSFNVTFS